MKSSVAYLGALLLVLSGNATCLPHARQTHFHSQVSETSEPVRFDEHKLLEINIRNGHDLLQLQLANEALGLDFWSPLPAPTQQETSVLVRVSPAQHTMIQGLMLNMTVRHENIQSLIDEQADRNNAAINRWSTSSDPSSYNFTAFFDAYQSYENIVHFMKNITAKYHKLAKIVNIGKTVEGRDILGVRLGGKERKRKKKHGRKNETADSVNTSYWAMDWLDATGERLSSWLDAFMKKNRKKGKKHPGIVIIGNQHGREWITNAVSLYIMHDMLANYGKDKAVKGLVDTFEWTFVPVVNVDGFEYSRVQNRLWRKNRQPSEYQFCYGIDLNRNWGYLWDNGGSSSNPCSESYMGKEAFSAPESKALSKYISKRGNVMSFVDLHAFAQLWMTPFGGDCSRRPKDNEDVLECALGSAKALSRVHGKQFAVGPVCQIVYEASGSALDWTYAVAGAKYSYTVELRDTGKHGFLLPPEEIIPSGEETSNAIKFMADFILQRELKKKRY